MSSIYQQNLYKQRLALLNDEEHDNDLRAVSASKPPQQRKTLNHDQRAQQARFQQFQIKQLEVQNIIGYTFKAPKHLHEALRAARAREANVGNERMADGNRRLAMIGDAAMKLALSLTWYETHDSRGDFDYDLKNVVTNENLNIVGRHHKLHEYVDNNLAQLRTGVGAITMASTVEAILGAVYLDSENDIHAVKNVMTKLGIVIR